MVTANRPSAKGGTVTGWTGFSDGSSLLPMLNVPPGNFTISGHCSQSRKTSCGLPGWTGTRGGLINATCVPACGGVAAGGGAGGETCGGVTGTLACGGVAGGGAACGGGVGAGGCTGGKGCGDGAERGSLLRGGSGAVRMAACCCGGGCAGTARGSSACVNVPGRNAYQPANPATTTIDAAMAARIRLRRLACVTASGSGST